MWGKYRLKTRKNRVNDFPFVLSNVLTELLLITDLMLLVNVKIGDFLVTLRKDATYERKKLEFDPCAINWFV